MFQHVPAYHTDKTILFQFFLRLCGLLFQSCAIWQPAKAWTDSFHILFLSTKITLTKSRQSGFWPSLISGAPSAKGTSQLPHTLVSHYYYV